MTSITADLFDISNRLRAIDERYRVFWNGCLDRYEVHSSETPSMFSMEFVVPFEELDVRTLEHALATRKENLPDLEEQITRHNIKIENQATIQMNKQTKQLYDMFAYANSVGHDVTFSRAKDWL